MPDTVPTAVYRLQTDTYSDPYASWMKQICNKDEVGLRYTLLINWRDCAVDEEDYARKVHQCHHMTGMSQKGNLDSIKRFLLRSLPRGSDLPLARMYLWFRNRQLESGHFEKRCMEGSRHDQG